MKLSLSDGYYMAPHGLMFANEIARYFHTAVCVENGKLSPDKSIPALLQGGAVTDKAMEDVYIGSSEQSFNGVVIDGGSEYEINRVKMDLEGFSENERGDFDLVMISVHQQVRVFSG